ncbi:MAG: TraR/DksA C4-type zinc finger protein [Candidatus Aminicenantes bacterium]|nr:TraR/DksA C4-type zinc finger protein [Candidatus Aminicenantes bacterium]
MNKKDKDQFEKILVKKKKENNKKIDEFYHESRTVVETGVAQDEGDRAENSYTKEFLLSLSDSERKTLQLIDDALKRIKDDTFGKCQMCGKDITMKRLGAVPWAPHCFDCQEKVEEESA